VYVKGYFQETTTYNRCGIQALFTFAKYNMARNIFISAKKLENIFLYALKLKSML
jgi:hypothetical protein